MIEVLTCLVWLLAGIGVGYYIGCARPAPASEAASPAEQPPAPPAPKDEASEVTGPYKLDRQHRMRIHREKQRQQQYDGAHIVNYLGN